MRAIVCLVIFLFASAALAEEDVMAVTPMTSARIDETAVMTRIAFGSCAQQEKDQPIWEAIAGLDPDLFLFIGDNMYSDPKVDGKRISGPELVAQAYRTLAARGDFGAFREQVPVLTTWDDHDYGLNDAGEQLMFREEAEALYLDAWAVAESDERRGRPGVYTSRIFGPEGKRVQIILLDTRYFRSAFKDTDEPKAKGKELYIPDAEEGKTVLGEAQWAWLEDELQKPADVRLLVSSFQVIAEGHGFERWGLLPKEQDRLYSLIASTGANGVVLLSGDRHLGAIYREEEAGPYPLTEVTASSLNLPSTNWLRGYVEPGPKRLGTVYTDENFGFIEIDWEAKAVAVELRSLTGELVQGHLVPLQDLTVTRAE